MNRLTRVPVVVAFSLVAVVVICATVLVGLGHTVPTWFETLGLVLAAGGAGATVPETAPSSSTDALVAAITSAVPAPTSAATSTPPPGTATAPASPVWPASPAADPAQASRPGGGGG